MIEAALAAGNIERVVVSTDDAEIGSVSRHHGAEVIQRPAELSGDQASSESALVHALETLRSQEGYTPAIVAFLQCTAPLTLTEDIEGTVRLVQGGYDSAVTVTPFHFFVWRENPEGHLVGVNHDAAHRLRRQDRAAEYMEVGAVYAMRTSGFLAHRFRFFGRIGKYILPWDRALELDEPADWDRAEHLISNAQHSSRSLNLAALKGEIRAVITDFDGVMTDNRVMVDGDGHESVICNRGDGWGISLLKRAGILVACISTETNPVVGARCKKLGIPYRQGEKDKFAALGELLGAHGIPLENCLYVGNDTNDAKCLQSVGIAVVPRDAAPEVRNLAHWTTLAGGGEGVLREIASALLAQRGSDDK
jgi:YrbI family 3-deoxy-D-manno-octulosonate 8-phosphate phosphatase